MAASNIMANYLPVTIIVSISVFRLQSTSTLSLITESFFSFDVLDQIALASLLIVLVFSAVHVSTFVGSPLQENHHHEHEAPPMYPLKELKSKTTDKEKFLCLFPTLRDSIAQHLSETHEMPPEAIDWVVEMMNYTCVGGKLNRGITVLSVVRTFAAPRQLTPIEEAKAIVLGWAIEFLQAFFLVADDFMDRSETRRGEPCWYLLPKVQTIAINDSLLLESFVFNLISQHFESELYFTDLLELFLQVIQQTECGQLLDLTSQSMDSKEVDLSRFSIERYKLIVKYKTAFYSFYLPVAIGMIISGVTDKKSFEIARNITCLMGEYFQIQDDVLDCYGAPEVIGKVGTDIQDNKCSWLVVQALDLATIDQRKSLEDNYGQWDDKKVTKIKALYDEMNLKTLFDKYEEESYIAIQNEMEKVNDMPKEVFTLFLKKIYKRSK